MDQALPRAPFAGKVLGLLGSAILHAGVVLLALSAVHRAPVEPSREVLYPIELTALGVPEGQPDAAGTPRVGDTVAPAPAPHPEAPAPASPAPVAPTAAAPRRDAASPPPRPDAPGPAPAVAASSSPEPPDKEAERAAMREAVRKAMLAPPDAQSPVAGAGSAAPQGSPDGTPGGKAQKPRVSARYASILDGWFSSRVSLRGFDLPWEELKKLRVTVSISLTPDRHVAGFSMAGSSGNAAYDARVRSSMQAIVSGGATLPAPPEGEEVPSNITLAFSCRTQERCS